MQSANLTIQSGSRTTQSASPIRRVRRVHRASGALILPAKGASSGDAIRKGKDPPTLPEPARGNRILPEKESANPIRPEPEKGNLRDRTGPALPIIALLHPDRVDIPSLSAPFPRNPGKESGAHPLERRLLKSPLLRAAKKAKRPKKPSVIKILKSTKHNAKPPSRTKPSTRATA